MRRAVLAAIVVLLFLVGPTAQVPVVKANPILLSPQLKIWLPEQFNAKTYQTSTVPIEIQIYVAPDYPKIIKSYYILDLNYSSNNNLQKPLIISEAQSSSIFGKPAYSYSATGTTDTLSNGTHTLDVYAVNAQGETAKSGTRTFLVNATSMANSGQPTLLNNITIVIVIAIAAIVGTITLVLLIKKKNEKVSK